jgi:Xaa-Pro aminopeptidase
MWGKQQGARGAVFADITWVSVTSARVPGEVDRAFGAVAGARDAAVALVESAARDGAELRGWEVDRVARAVLDRDGYGPSVLHRTGHSSMGP